jgi:hypothetical protein
VSPIAYMAGRPGLTAPAPTPTTSYIGRSRRSNIRTSPHPAPAAHDPRHVAARTAQPTHQTGGLSIRSGLEKLPLGPADRARTRPRSAAQFWGPGGDRMTPSLGLGVSRESARAEQFENRGAGVLRLALRDHPPRPLLPIRTNPLRRIGDELAALQRSPKRLHDLRNHPPSEDHNNTPINKRCDHRTNLGIGFRTLLGPAPNVAPRCKCDRRTRFPRERRKLPRWGQLPGGFDVIDWLWVTTERAP